MPRTGERGATLHDVAERAGVNVATASRALNEERRQLVGADTAKRVLAAAEALDYQPHPFGRGLKTNRSQTVGVLVPDLTNPLYPPIVRGIDDALSAAGYTPLIANTDNDPERERQSFDALASRQVDGFIFATALRRHPLLAEAAERGLTLALVLRGTSAARLPGAAVDERAGMRSTLAHLRELGHRRVGYVAGPQEMSPPYERRRAFLALRKGMELDGDPDLVRVARSFAIADGRRLAGELLAATRPPTAIVAANDQLALGCLDAIAEAGLRCPRDISVVGCNDMPLADRITPALTTVRVPQYELGRKSAELLLQGLEAGGDPLGTVRLVPTLIIRHTTGAISGGR
jgi:LacI family transcriptional regulator